MNRQGWICQVRTLKTAQFIVIYTITNERVTYHQLVNKLEKLPCSVGNYLQAVTEPHPSGSTRYATEQHLVSVIRLIKGITPPYGMTQAVRKDTATKHRVYELRRPEFCERILRTSDVKHRLLQYLMDHRWVAIESPKIQDASAQSGGTELFAVNYYGRIKYLSQSPQLYKQIAANTWGRVYEIGAVYRAEPSDTNRHLSEATCLDIEMVCTTLQELYAVIRDLMRVAGLGSQVPVYGYWQLCDRIGKGDGLDFTRGQLQALAADLPALYIIERYPRGVKPFYIKHTGALAQGFDLYYRDIQLASGGLREQDPDALLAAMVQKGIAVEPLDWYLMNFRYGCRPHGGFSIGLARLMMCLCDCPDIRDVVLFPLSYSSK